MTLMPCLMSLPAAINLGAALKWEYVEERGDTFPHLYSGNLMNGVPRVRPCRGLSRAIPRAADVSRIIKLPLNEEVRPRRHE